MGFQRGTYGVEYDQNQKSSTGKLWLLSVVIPLLAIFLVLRGCFMGSSNGGYSADDTSHTESLAPEVKVERERPSIATHFLQSWRNKLRGEVATESERPAAMGGGDQALIEESGNKRHVEEVKIETLGLPDEVARLLKRAQELEDSGDLVSARMILQKLRLRLDAATVRPLVEKRIGEVNTKLILSDKPMPGKLLYTIQSGDLVSRLTHKYGNTEEYILRVNKIDHPEKIRIGQELWVLDNPIFELMIDKSDFKAVLLFNNSFFKTYQVGLGDPGTVPAGSYEVRSRNQIRDRLSKETYSVLLVASGNTSAVSNLTLSGAANESNLGMISQAEGIVFNKSGIEELYVLLSAGSIVTIIE